MDEKHRTGADPRAEDRAEERVGAPEPQLDQEGDFAIEHSLPSSDPRHDPSKAGRSGFQRLRRRARA